MSKFIRIILGGGAILVALFQNISFAGFLSEIANKAKNAAKNVKEKAKEIKNDAKSRINDEFAKVKSSANEVKEQGKQIVSDVKEAGVDKINETKNVVTTKIEETKDVVNTAKTVTQNAKDELLSKTSDVIGLSKSEEGEELDKIEEIDEVKKEVLTDADVTIIADEQVQSKEKNDNSEKASSSADQKEEIVEYSADSIAKISSIFPKNDIVETGRIINLKNSNITDEDVQYLLSKFEELPKESMEKLTLILSGNKFTIEGLAAILEKLKSYPKLVSVIDFSDNNLGDEGAMLIASYLSSLPGLTFIVLSDNDITGVGALAFLAEVARINNAILQMIDLSGNKITSEYWNQILEQVNLFKSSSLEDGIDLSKNPLEVPEGAEVPAIIRLKRF
ncbi:MAG: hypothetical protein LBI95_01620 [Holosporales bacterium]|nr:hypothetical protein [Holosporales bacterium]